jgi:hypothetical protein
MPYIKIVNYYLSYANKFGELLFIVLKPFQTMF